MHAQLTLRKAVITALILISALAALTACGGSVTARVIEKR
jgi:hypothetical protein